MFSLEGPGGKRFLTRSRLFTDPEWAALGETDPLPVNAISCVPNVIDIKSHLR
jgi:hypothetical protein